MSLELDHFITFCPAGAGEVDRLLEEGLAEGPPNQHPGQGTACRRLFFDNAYLEFLYPTDEQALASPLVAPTGLLPRFRGGCPLGVALRGEAPFDTWAYRPLYLPVGTAISMASSSGLAAEPLIFLMPALPRPLNSEGGLRRPPCTPRSEGLRRESRSITRVQLAGPWPDPPSAALAVLSTLPHFQVTPSPHYHAEITLGPGTRLLDLRPGLALSLLW